jgi:hypothetical protein
MKAQDHRTARNTVQAALALELGRMATLAELQAVQAVGAIETQYGTKVPEAGKASHNWGNIHWVEGKGNGRAMGFYLGKDADSTGKPYDQKFCSYPGPVEGVADIAALLRRMGVLDVANASGSAYAVAAKMRAAGYYGDTKSPEGPQIDRYARGLSGIVAEMRTACGDKGGLAPDGLTPRSGAAGDWTVPLWIAAGVALAWLGGVFG